VLDVGIMLPQVAQGALAIECRADDGPTCELVKQLDEPRSRLCVDAERSFLASIGGACDLPVAGHAIITPDGRLELEGLLAAPDGSALVRRKATGPVGDGARLGAEVARTVLNDGGGDLLAARGERR